MIELSTKIAPNAKYGTHAKNQRIGVRRGPHVSTSDEVFTIGSCFAREIRAALNELHTQVTPRFATLAIDPSVVRVDDLPQDEHLNYYNAFTILQEFQRAVGLWEQAEDDFWTVPSALWPEGEAFQDPYRRLVFGRDLEHLRQVTSDLNRIIKEAFHSADAFLITYGMTEVFRSKKNGKIVCQKPLYGGGGGATETEFWQSTYEDNVAAIRETVRLIKGHNPQARIFVTVSPIPLERTFSGNDVVVANTEGKAILRAALGQVSRESPDVTYFPAYEAVMANGRASFNAYGRHVLPAVVQLIVQAFVAAHVQLDGEPSSQLSVA